METDYPFPIVFFDGECVLCNRACQLLLNASVGSSLKFSALQSNTGINLLGEKSTNSVSIIYWENGSTWQEKQAIVKALKHCNGIGWQSFRLLALVAPAFIVNGVYRWVAKNRFAWFGRTECWLKDNRVLA